MTYAPPPALFTAPTGPMARLLRRMLAAPLVAVAVGPGRVSCTVGGCEADSRLVAGLLDRGLIAPRADCGTEATVYSLTPAGRAWAEESPEATS